MLSIKTEIGKALRTESGPDLAAVEQSLAAQVARYLGAAVRQRVEGTGDLAGQRFPGWDSGTYQSNYHLDSDGKYRQRKDAPKITRASNTKWVSARYPDRTIGPIGRGGAKQFLNSAAYHARNATRPGTYHTTGGMWEGLSAVIASRFRASVRFRGRSEGQDARFVGGKSRPLKVSNALKAATVLNQHGVNVLVPTEQELAFVAEAGTHVLGAAAGRELGVVWSGAPPRSGTVEEVFAAVFRARGLALAVGAA